MFVIRDILIRLLHYLMDALFYGEQALNGTMRQFANREGRAVPLAVSKPYVFRAFHYEMVRPHSMSRVPYPRSGHRIGADSTNFYSFGGYNPQRGDVPEAGVDENNDELLVQSYPLFQELWKFNFARREWARYPNNHTLPQELASNALLLHKNCLMVFGGTGSPFGFRCSNQLFVCRLKDNKGIMSEIKTSGELPMPAYGQALIYHNSFLYTIGGTTGISYNCDIHRLNLNTLVWEAVYIRNGQNEYEPTGRYRHEVGFDTKHIFVLGGGTAIEVFDFSKIPVFNIDRRTWHQQTTIEDPIRGCPKARRCHGAVQIVRNTTNQEMFIAGGHDGECIFDDLWRIDLTTFQWTYFERCTLPRPTFFHACAATPQGRLYIFGGIHGEQINNNDADDNGNDEGENGEDEPATFDGDVYRNNLIFSTWLCIPKLSEMCWEAVLHYWPHVVNEKGQTLIDMGFPRHFVQRLEN